MNVGRGTGCVFWWLAAALAGCEASTSGGDQVADITRGGASAGGSGTDLPSAGTAGATAGVTGEPELPACLDCATTSCIAELATCGTTVCGPLIECLAGCDDGACRDGCLNASDLPLVVEATSCLRRSCAEACDVSGEVEEPESAAVTAARADCGRFEACAPELLALSYGDLDGCVAQASKLTGWRAALPDSGATEESLLGCADELAALDCDRYFAVGTARPSCVMRGARKTGAPCFDGVQCGSGFCPSASFACATCAPMPRAGDACSAPEDCPTGLYCTASAGKAGTCVVPSTEGASCDAQRPCDAYLACVSGICVPVAAKKGAACGSATASPICDLREGLICNSATNGTCINYQAVTTGVACGLVNGIAQLCGRAGQCTNGRCVAGPATGGKCAADGPFCLWPDTCVNGSCVGVPTKLDCSAGGSGQ